MVPLFLLIYSIDNHLYNFICNIDMCHLFHLGEKRVPIRF